MQSYSTSSETIPSKTDYFNQSSINKLSNTSFTPYISNGFVRDGSSMSKAIDLSENVSQNESLNQSSVMYFRYYALYPYQYVNISLTANSSTSTLYLYDQFQNLILLNNNSLITKSIVIGSSKSFYKDNIRFIGWYYIKVVSFFNPLSFNLKFNFITGDGSSLWSPIVIKPGTPAYSKSFVPMENSNDVSSRSSLFFSFYVNMSFPDISFQITNASWIWLYDPNYNLLSTNLLVGNWIAQIGGYYYLEVVGNTNTNLVINLKLQNQNKTLGSTYDQPLEISRNNGIHFELSNLITNRIKYLKLYLYAGENVTVKILNNRNSVFYTTVYGPWGTSPYIINSNTPKSFFNISLNNVEDNGYYIFRIQGSGASYTVIPTFLYKLQEGISWQSAKRIDFNSNYIDRHYLFIDKPYYYRIDFQSGLTLSVSLTGSMISNATILGSYRQIIGFLSLNKTNQGNVILPPINNSATIYIRINPKASISNFLLSIKSIQSSFSSSIHVKGRLIYKNIKTNEISPIPLIQLYLIQEINSEQKILAISSTNAEGYFSIIYTGHLEPINESTSFFIMVHFEGPALQLLSYLDTGQGSILGSIYIIKIPLNKNNLIDSKLGDILLSSVDFNNEIANIFSIITTGWLWLSHLTVIKALPQQIHVLYSPSTPFTGYLPNYVINYKDTKYVVFYIGANSNDDDGWDNTVILHEYGHHVEQTYAIANNPGWRHAYSTTVSPELANGEGFPTFFASIVLNTSVYQDTKIVGPTTGINLETGRLLGSNTLEDLFGSFGETSVMMLYYDLVDSSNSDDGNSTGFGDSTTLSINDLFNVFVNFRNPGGLGVTNTNELYQGLIQTNPNAIDNISKSFYAHGNSYYELPFLEGTQNQIIASNNNNANFTWQFFDSNPKSYQLLVDSALVKTGKWNFTEEMITINIHQFNFLTGSIHYFTIKLNDTLNSQRVYTFTVKIVSSLTTLGKAFSDSILINPNQTYNTFNQTTYFSYFSTKNEFLNLSFIEPSTVDFKLQLFENNSLIYTYTINTGFNYFFIDYNASSILTIVFQYISGLGMLHMVLSNNTRGFSFTNPIKMSGIGSSFTIDNSHARKYYVEVIPTYINRLIELTRTDEKTLTATIFFANETILKTFILNNTTPSTKFSLPIEKMVSETSPYNPFMPYIIQFSTEGTFLGVNMALHHLQLSKITYIGPENIVSNPNQELLFNYTTNQFLNYEIIINNDTYAIGSLKNVTIGNNTFNLSIRNLPLGFYIVDIKIQDANGLIEYSQFSFFIVTKTFFLSLSFEQTLLLFSLVVILSLSAISLYLYNKNHPGKLKTKMLSFLKFKKSKIE